MTHQVAHDDGGYQVYRVVNGRYRLDCGPRFATPSAAAIYCDALDLAARTEALREDAPSSEPSVPLSAYVARVPTGAHPPGPAVLSPAQRAGTTLFRR